MEGVVLVSGDVGEQRKGLPGDQGLIGNYKGGVWYDDHQFTDFNTVARGHAPISTRGNWGFYGLFDQMLVRFGEPGSNRGFGVTGSSLISPQQSISPMPFSSTSRFPLPVPFPSPPVYGAGFR